jgi:hypothetical protein
MLEKGTSGLMSGEGKRATASRPRTALFLDSTSRGIYWRKQATLLGPTTLKIRKHRGLTRSDRRPLPEFLSISAVACTVG